jgi:hypothetical protein
MISQAFYLNMNGEGLCVIISPAGHIRNKDIVFMYG